jgi:hypothetical protein
LRDAPDIRPDDLAFLKSGIRPDTGLDMTVVRANTRYGKVRTFSKNTATRNAPDSDFAGYPANLKA